jgi:hypothetical protein
LAPRVGGTRRGCLALTAVPLLAIAAPIVAWRRRAAVRRRGNLVLLSIRRGSFGKLGRLSCELDSPLPRVGELVEAISGAVAEGASWAGRTVGCVGIVPGDEPVLVALAPGRDVVAARVRGTLERGEAHRYPELWLTLPPGTYLAQVVDPYAAFAGDEASILALLREHGVGHALRTEVLPGVASSKILLTLYAPRPDLRKLLTLAKSVLAELPGWILTR